MTYELNSTEIKFCGKDMEEAYQQGREEREEEIIDLIYFFEKTWNKESHKRVSHIAISEMIEFIMQNDTKEDVKKQIMEQIGEKNEDSF